MRIIAGRWKGRRLNPIRGRAVRPTSDRVREAWMAALTPELPSARILDLFAGSGALGLEALSRGAGRVVFVERSRRAVGTLRRNVELLDARDLCEIVSGDAYRFLRTRREREPGEHFDVALADPPYGEGHAERLLRIFAVHPFARALWLEHRSTDPVPELPGLRQRGYGDTLITTIRADP